MRQKEFIFCLQRNLLSPHVSLHCSGEMLAGRKRGEELDLSFATVLPELLLPGLHNFFLPIMPGYATTANYRYIATQQIYKFRHI